MKSGTILVALATAAAMFGGCATRRTPSLADRFIRSGQPAVDAGGPDLAKAADPSLSEFMQKVRYLSTRRPEPQHGTAATIERTDSRLAAALLAEAAAPTAQAHLDVAAEYRRLGVLDSAYEAYNRALQVDAHNAEAYEGLARAWRDWRLPALALTDAYRAVYYDPRSASARNTLGTVLDALGHDDAARRAYRAAVALDPSAAWALNNLCYLEFRRGRFRDARVECTAALKIAPEMAAAHNNLGLTLAAAGDLAGAQREFLAVGDRAQADFNMGIVYLAKHQYALAAHHFEDAAEHRPAFKEARVRARQAASLGLGGSQ